MKEGSFFNDFCIKKLHDLIFNYIFLRFFSNFILTEARVKRLSS